MPASAQKIEECQQPDCGDKQPDQEESSPESGQSSLMQSFDDILCGRGGEDNGSG